MAEASRSVLKLQTVPSLAAVFLVALAGCADETPVVESKEPEPEGVPYASPGFSNEMTALAPVGWWRLGETSGTSAADSSGHGHTGTYVNTPSLGGAGAIVGDANKAITVTPGAGQTCSDSEYVEVPDHDDFSLVKAQDGFNRTVALGSSWGTADHGGAWTAQVTTGSFYSVDGNVAKIHETNSGTWQIGLGTTRDDADIQVRATWSVAASGGVLQPLTVVARRVDANNYYRAELRENPGGQLDLRLTKVVSGTSTILTTTTNVGTYALGDWWYVRFQLEGTALRARAWKYGTTQPTSWQATWTDSSLASGTVSLRSANSLSTVNPTVSFEGFRVQSMGMTVHAFMRPDDLDFTGETSENYIYFLGKAGDPQNEWAFRFYPLSSTRPNRISAYTWNLTTCCGFPTNLGAGAYFQDTLTAGEWIQVVAVYDPGDELDTLAGVTIYRDGTCRQGKCGGSVHDGTLYSNPSFRVYPLNGTAPLRIGTRDCQGSLSFFTGGLDEVAIFDRKLSATEIADLYTQSQ